MQAGPVFWKVTIEEYTHSTLYFALGVSSTAQPRGDDSSYKDGSSFGWDANGRMAGAPGGHEGWQGWQPGDVAVFKLDADRLSMRVRRLDQTFSIATNGARDLRLWTVWWDDKPRRVRFSQADPGDEF